MSVNTFPPHRDERPARRTLRLAAASVALGAVMLGSSIVGHAAVAAADSGVERGSTTSSSPSGVTRGGQADRPDQPDAPATRRSGTAGDVPNGVADDVPDATGLPRYEVQMNDDELFRVQNQDTWPWERRPAKLLVIDEQPELPVDRAADDELKRR